MPLIDPATLRFGDAELSAAEQLALVEQAEALVAYEIGLGTLELAPQSLQAVELTDYGFTVPHDGPLLALPVGPVTTLAELQIDGQAIAPADLIAAPWTMRRRDGEWFSCGADASISATVGWATAAALPERIRAAVQLLLSDLAGLYVSRASPASESIGPLQQTFGNPKRERVHQLIGRIVSPWTRPQSA